MLYLYALLDDRPVLAPVVGVSGGSVRVESCGRAYAAVEDAASVPALSADALRRHDAVVRAITAGAAAVGPVRFGSTVASFEALEDSIAQRWADIEALFGLIRDREQMTLRIFAREDPGENGAGLRADEGDASANGTAYLRARAARRRPLWQAIEELRTALAGMVAAERVDDHGGSRMASVYHLVARGCDGYVERTTRVCQGPVRIVASGPAPCYAFAEGISL